MTTDVKKKGLHKHKNTVKRDGVGTHGPPVLTVDYELYTHFLEDSDLSEDQKQEFVQTLWNIIVEFVSLGWGVHPLQQAKKPCGQLEETPPKPILSGPDGVKYSHEILEKFEVASAPDQSADGEGVKP